MNKSLGLVSKGVGVTSREDKKRAFYEEAFAEKGFRTEFFDWTKLDYDAGTSFERADGTYSRQGSIRDLDYIAISSLGQLEGREADFLSFLDVLKGCEKPYVVNHPATMKRNLDKQYLIDLQELGVAVVPTRELKNEGYSALEKEAEEFTGDLVLKPRFFGERSSGVVKLSELSDQEDLNEYLGQHKNGVLVQPFLPGIHEHGERSLVFVGYEFSHGVYRPRTDWKPIQGVKADEVIEPTRQEMDAIRPIMRDYPAEFRLTRFDFITQDGKPMISEIEMINPNIWTGKGIKEIDERFTDKFSKFLLRQKRGVAQ